MTQQTKETPGADNPAETGRPRLRFGHRARDEHREKKHGSNRETVESVVIAFVLAFLFRTFEAEAFVIPTGSMAPTLMGRHKEITCAECGTVFTVGATDEVDDKGRMHQPLTECICPNCRFQNEVGQEPAFKGDRILVLKALYDLPEWAPERLREPQRWDVLVFKYPEDPQTNYIKRMVGVPNEEVAIYRGNIYTRASGESEFRVACKPPHKQQVLRMLVFDNNHQPKSWPAGWPARWQSEPADAWQATDGSAFELADHRVEDGDWSRLSYHHLIADWNPQSSGPPPHEQLITDFYSYNVGMSDGHPFGQSEPPPHWVGDLSLSFTATVSEARGKLRAELVEAGERFICEFELETGTCRLLRQRAEGDGEQVLDEARSVIRRPGKYEISFANVDDRLTVWVDDKLPFGDGYDYDGLRLGDSQRPAMADLRPATVSAQSGRVRVSDLVLHRDIYYTHSATRSDYNGGSGTLDEVFSTPSLWSFFENVVQPKVYRLGPDEFLMCGDNSPRSRDGREWEKGAGAWVRELSDQRGLPPEIAEREIAEKPGGEIVSAGRHVVRRQLLIGRAFYVYWPHGVPFGPKIDVPLGRLGTYRIPFYPNVARMKMIE